MIKKKHVIIIIFITIILISLIVMLFNNKMTINKNAIKENYKSIYKEDGTIDTSGWDLSKVNIVTDPEGVPVPVPIGFTASSAENEKYVNGRTVEYNGNLSELEWKSTGEYSWQKNSDGIWTSQNAGVANSESTMEAEFVVGKDGGQLEFEWSVSSQDYVHAFHQKPTYYDYLMIALVNNTTGDIERVRKCSTEFGENYNELKYIEYKKILEEGQYRITISYIKDGETDAGTDTAYIKNANLFNYDENGTTTISGQVDGGFVIYEGNEEITDENAWNESLSRNQFVWIPVKDTSRIYEENSSGKKKSKLYEYSLLNRTLRNGIEPGIDSGRSDTELLQISLKEQEKYSLLEEIEVEYEEMIKSVEKYGGFYIGRYESGKLNTKKPVIQRMQNGVAGNHEGDSLNSNWYNSYAKSKNISQNENISCGVIWGCLWDETVQWLTESNCKSYEEISNKIYSKEYGNYFDVEFSYTDTNGSKSIKKLDTSNVIPTGSTERNKTNNIYDMAGNVWEWTMEAEGGTNRQIRGGSSGYSCTYLPISGKFCQQPTAAYYYDVLGCYGTRAYCYIK